MICICRHTFAALCALSCIAAGAQDAEKASKGKWTGNVDVTAGSNFKMTPRDKKTNNTGSIAATFEYEAPKFGFTVSGNVPYSHKITGKIGRNFEIAETKDTTMAYDNAAHESTNFQTTASAQFNWKPSQTNQYRISYSYDHNSTLADNYNVTTGPVGGKTIDLSFSKERVDTYNETHDIGFRYQHTFDKTGRTLSVDWKGHFTSFSKFSETKQGEGSGIDITALGPDPEFSGRQYRNTPYSNNNDSFVAVSFSEPDLADVKKLNLNVSLEWDFKELYDHSRAATYIDGQWVDSTSVRENFRYRTSSIKPKTQVSYSTGGYEVALTYSPESFAQKLDSDNKIGDIDKGRIANIIDFTNRLDLGHGHLLQLNFGLHEERPSYLQMCWFPRHTGNMNANEIYQGNPDLLSSVKTSISLSYQYSSGKGFSSAFTTSYNGEPRKIEGTYNDEIIDDREYRVYTWVNGGKSFEITNSLRLSYSRNGFTANAQGIYTVYRGLSLSGSKTFSGNWSVSADAQYIFRTWTVNISGEYHSDIVRTYTSRTSVVGLNAKITKTFGDHFTAYIEGRNLLDRHVITTIMSEDETSLRSDESINNDRLFVIGLNYRF